MSISTFVGRLVDLAKKTTIHNWVGICRNKAKCTVSGPAYSSQVNGHFLCDNMATDPNENSECP